MSLKLLKRILLIAVSALMIASTQLIPANAQNRPAPISREEQNIPINLDTPFTVYFEYGSNVSDINITNAIANATIINSIDSSSNPAFEFVANDVYKNYDIYEGDPARDASDPAPRSAFPCDTFDGPRYEIPSSFFSSYEMEDYGLQTAKNTAQETAILTKGSSGCIALQVQVSDAAQLGDKAFIQFDSDAGPSPDFEASVRPNLLIQPLAVVEAEEEEEVIPEPISVASSEPEVIEPAPASSSVISEPAPATPRSGGSTTSFLMISLSVLAISTIFYISRKTKIRES